MKTPTPTLRPDIDHRSLLAEISRHDGQTPQLNQLCDAVNELHHQATEQLQNHPEALAQMDNARFANTVNESELGHSLHDNFSAAAMLQLHPGKKKKDLSEEEQNYVTNTASLNTTAVGLLANANQLTAQTVAGLFCNTSLVVDSVMNTVSTASRNNLNSTMRLRAMNNFQDPNSPTAVLAAMQSGNGDFLVNILRDSTTAALIDNNVEAAAEQQQQFQIQTEEQQVENDQTQNLVMAENVEAEQLAETSQETQASTLPTPQPKPGAAKKLDEEEENVLSASPTPEATPATHHLKDAAKPLEELAEKGVEHAALKEVGKIAAHIITGAA